MPSNLSLSHTKLDKLYVHRDRKAAEDFLHRCQVTTAGTPILVPFWQGGEIQFLKPQDKEDCLRIIGAANAWKEGGKLRQLTKIRRRVGHLKDLIDENILLGNGIIIIYQRAEKRLGLSGVGEQINGILQRGIENCESDQSNCNDQVRFNIARITTALSQQALNSAIIAGMAYFIAEGGLYRYTFKQGFANAKSQCYLRKESELNMSIPMYMEHEIRKESHDVAFILDCVKWIFLATIMALIAGGVGELFFSPLLGVSFALATLVGLSLFGFDKASNDNKPTEVYGPTKFIPIASPKVATPPVSVARQRVQDQLKSDTMALQPASQVSMVASIENGVTDKAKAFFMRTVNVQSKAALFLVKHLAASQSLRSSPDAKSIIRSFLS